jgi:hypothetical protein
MAEEETSMKKVGSLLALVLALILLMGSYIYIKNRPQKEENPGGEDTPSAVEQISNVEKDKIVKMILTSENGDLVFEKKDEEWIIPGVKHMLKQSSIEDIASSFANMFAEKLIEENPKDLEIYGLKYPAVTAKAVLSDGTEKVLYLGDRTPVGNTFYIMPKDSQKVYTVWMNHGSRFSTTLNELRDKKLFDFELEEMTYLKIVNDKGRPIEIITNDDENDEGRSYGINLFTMTKPYSKPTSVDTQKLEQVAQGLQGIEIRDFIEDDVKDLSKYGLDKPRLEILAKDTENNVIHVFIGKDMDERLVYFRTADSNSVYSMEKGKVTPFEVEPFTLMSKFAYIVNIDWVDKVIIEEPGKKHTLTLTRQTEKAEKEGEKDEVVTTYKVDGKEVEEDAFKKYYQSLIGLIVDAENDRKVEEKAEITTTYYLNHGPEKQVTVKYAPYNENFYAVFRDGVADFVISKGKVQRMLNDLEQLKNK